MDYLLEILSVILIGSLPFVTILGIILVVLPFHKISNYSYDLTNKRLIMAQKKMFNENIKIIILDNLNDIHTVTGIAWCVITIDPLKEKVNVMLNKTQADNIYRLVDPILYEYCKNKQSATSIQNQPIEKLWLNK